MEIDNAMSALDRLEKNAKLGVQMAFLHNICKHLLTLEPHIDLPNVRLLKDILTVLADEDVGFTGEELGTVLLQLDNVAINWKTLEIQQQSPREGLNDAR